MTEPLNCKQGLYGPIPRGARGSARSQQFAECSLFVVRRRQATKVQHQRDQQWRVQVNGSLGWKCGRSVGRCQWPDAATATATSTTSSLGNISCDHHILIDMQLQRFNHTYILFIVDSSSGLSFIRTELRQSDDVEWFNVTESTTYLLRHYDDNNQHHYSHYVCSDGHSLWRDEYSYH